MGIHTMNVKKTHNKIIKIFLMILFSLSLTLNCKSQESLQRRNAVKITFLSWFTGTTKLSYERHLLGNQTGELTVGVICAGFDKFKNNPKGFTIRYAHKFILKNKSDYALNGYYVKPEIVWSNFNYDRRNDELRTKANMAGLFACTGYQWARKKFLVDGYVGVGGSIGQEADTYYHHGFVLWNYFNSFCKNVAMTFAIKFGYNF